MYLVGFEGFTCVNSINLNTNVIIRTILGMKKLRLDKVIAKVTEQLGDESKT